jgi:hypothetical protein
VDKRKRPLKFVAVHGAGCMVNKKFLLLFSVILIINLISCVRDMGGVVILKPDESSHVYEANETVILKAVARVFKEKNIGTHIRIDQTNLQVDSDYLESGDWRTKAGARVKRLNWKECEVILAVITEKKTKAGWEMRRLLQKAQYDTIFDVIELKIYEEMSNVE